jgi:Protein of unknown function (DUF1236)
MMTLHRIGYVVVPLALLGVATVAQAQSTTTTTTTTIEKSVPMKLTPQQRTVIYRTVKREQRVIAPTDVQVSVGAPVPPAIVLAPLPDSVYVEVPAARPLKYFYINNQLVLVDPSTSQVVEIIDQ